MKSSLTKRILLVSTLCAATLLFGFVMGKIRNEDEVVKSIDIFSETLYHVKTKYVEKIDDKKIFDGALRGLIENLDPESFYMKMSEYEEFKKNNNSLPGDAIGIKLIKLNSYLRAISVEPGGPADKAGIKAGDFITHISGYTGYDLSLYAAYKLLSGEPGTSVKIEILDNITGEEKKLEPIREKIAKVSPIIDTFKNKKITYIYPAHFYLSDVDFILKEIENCKTPKLIIDLRFNYEGEVSAAQKALDFFIDSGVLFTEIKDKQTRTEYKAKPGAFKFKGELILLTGSSTTHFAEVFAAVMHEKKLASTIGYHTRGLVGVQDTFPLETSGAIHITNTVYETSSGETLYMKGITVDRVIEITDEDVENKKVLKSDNGIFSKEDIVLSKALNPPAKE